MLLWEAFELAQQHFRAGRPQDAESICSRILSQKPDQPDALQLMGLIANQAGRPDAAVRFLERVVHLAPTAAEPLFHLGVINSARGDYIAATDNFQKSLALQPNCHAYDRLGIAQSAMGRIDDAISSHGKAVELQPDNADFHNNLGLALQKTLREEQAIAAYQQAVRLQPNRAELLGNLGAALGQIGRFDEAMMFLQQAIAAREDFIDAYCNAANFLYSRRRLDESIAFCRRAIDIDPAHAAAHCNLAFSLLCQGNLQEGWREYAWRSQVNIGSKIYRDYSQPQWTGDHLNGRTVLLHHEQGFGDTIQFIRYLPMAMARGGKVLMLLQPKLLPLFQRSVVADQWIPAGGQLPAFDLHCPLMTLPLVMDTRMETIPAKTPYLFAEPSLCARWRERMQPIRQIKVGLAWAGHRLNPNDRNRSIFPSELDPLADVQGVQFISLQKDDIAESYRRGPAKMNLMNWTGELVDFSETAALIENLDLVITVDSVIAHLAGALGKPTWVLLPFGSDWRWMLDREDSPWYPTLRLFRQTQPGDWSSPIGAVASELRQMATGASR
jgi:tetratricopeptide (TPR) repeat protein